MEHSLFVRARGRAWPLLLCLVALTGGACATGARPRPFPTPEARTSAPDPGERPGVGPEGVIATALALRGIPYRNGGADASGFDCSGFTQYVYARHGVVLPRAVREQFRTGQDIDGDDLEAGDLLFFATEGRGATHVGIAIGGDQFVHAPSSTGVVRVERFTAGYWSRRFVGARRVN
jgi:cell wall-associated NlpC family hydrolase